MGILVSGRGGRTGEWTAVYGAVGGGLDGGGGRTIGGMEAGRFVPLFGRVDVRFCVDE